MNFTLENKFSTRINPLSVSWCSFEGHQTDLRSGMFGQGSGDVNGDGFDDIIIGTKNKNPGSIYLIFGRGAGLKNNDSLANADVEFLQESQNGGKLWLGCIAGDLNKDGYDDILLGDHRFSSQNKIGRGKVYIFFGKSDGWKSKIDVKDCDASFIGENSLDWAGWLNTGIGDINNDTFDDFLIGAYGYDTEEFEDSGKVYIIFGKKIGWQKDVSLGSCQSSFHGTAEREMIGWPDTAAQLGDINGDNIDDFIVSSRYRIGLSSKVENYIVFGRSDG
jgi:hypothetical protein